MPQYAADVCGLGVHAVLSYVPVAWWQHHSCHASCIGGACELGLGCCGILLPCAACCLPSSQYQMLIGLLEHWRCSTQGLMSSMQCPLSTDHCHHPRPESFVCRCRRQAYLAQRFCFLCKCPRCQAEQAQQVSAAAEHPQHAGTSPPQEWPAQLQHPSQASRHPTQGPAGPAASPEPAVAPTSPAAGQPSGPGTALAAATQAASRQLFAEQDPEAALAQLQPALHAGLVSQALRPATPRPPQPHSGAQHSLSPAGPSGLQAPPKGGQPWSPLHSVPDAGPLASQPGLWQCMEALTLLASACQRAGSKPSQQLGPPQCPPQADARPLEQLAAEEIAQDAAPQQTAAAGQSCRDGRTSQQAGEKPGGLQQGADRGSAEPGPGGLQHAARAVLYHLSAASLCQTLVDEGEGP